MVYSGPLDSAIEEVDKLIRHLKSLRVVQVRSVSERELIRAYASSWSQKYRPLVASALAPELIRADSLYLEVSTASYKATKKETYISNLKELRKELISLQGKVFIKDLSKPVQLTPDFSVLVPNKEMEGLLRRRTQEIIESIDKSPLSATIMIGALLEALFLVRVNLLKDKKRLFKLKSTPKDKAGEALELKEWGLNDFIEVSHEIGWIRKPVKDISAVLRDYRNVIHPVKELNLMRELRLDVLITAADAKMFWRIFNELCQQISDSASV